MGNAGDDCSVLNTTAIVAGNPAGRRNCANTNSSLSPMSPPPIDIHQPTITAIALVPPCNHPATTLQADRRRPGATPWCGQHLRGRLHPVHADVSDDGGQVHAC